MYADVCICVDSQIEGYLQVRSVLLGSPLSGGWEAKRRRKC